MDMFFQCDTFKVLEENCPAVPDADDLFRDQDPGYVIDIICYSEF